MGRLTKALRRARKVKRALQEFEVVADQVRRNKEGLITRLERNLVVVPNPKLGTPCRLWIGSCRGNGYPRINFRRVGGRCPVGHNKNVVQLGVHRLFLILRLGRPIDPDCEAGHLCHTPSCVAHGQEMTRTTNLRQRDERQKEQVPF